MYNFDILDVRNQEYQVILKYVDLAFHTACRKLLMMKLFHL